MQTQTEGPCAPPDVGGVRSKRIMRCAGGSGKEVPAFTDQASLLYSTEASGAVCVLRDGTETLYE